jgi:hypothetical protein
MYLFMLGFSTIVAADYNTFKDPFSVVLIVFWVGVVELCTWIVKKIAYLLDFWGYASLDGKLREESGATGS